MNELIFKLSELESIKIVTDRGIDFTDAEFCCDDISAYFIHQQRLCIGQETVGLIFEAWISRLNKVINSKLFLHESLTQNLGLMQNQYYQDKSGFFMVSKIGRSKPYWIGFDYSVWSTYGYANPLVSTWLYNDENHNIIFEATKDYPWHFIELEGQPKDPDFINYDEFMKNYKPLIHRVIPRDVAIVWLEQAMKVYREFFKDEKDFIRACNEMNE